MWVVVGIGALIIFVIGFLPTLLVIVITEGFALRSVVVYGVIGAALALAMAFGLDFSGYRARRRYRHRARTRGLCRSRHCRRHGLLAVRRPARRFVEVIRRVDVIA